MPTDQPPILAIADDLLVTSRIEAAAEATGRDVRFVRSAAEFGAVLNQTKPALILVGMAATRLPWPDLIREAKAASSAPYVLAFGPHKDLELRRRALEAGADRVIANSAFAKALPTLLGTPAADVDDHDR